MIDEHGLQGRRRLLKAIVDPLPDLAKDIDNACIATI